MTNEGNADLSANAPELRICSVGLEKIIPKNEHLAVFIRLLTRQGIIFAGMFKICRRLGNHFAAASCLPFRSFIPDSRWTSSSGSVLFSEEEFRVNTIGVFAHDIVILLDPAEIVENIHDAYAHPHFRDRAYSLLMSGPSGSADIAGTTVHPAQGVMTLTVIFWPRAQKGTQAV